MAALNTLVQNYVGVRQRHTRDFTGARGWIALSNQFLRQLEAEGLFEIGLRKEIGVEVSDDYWITLPSDCRKVLEVYYPPLVHYTEKQFKYRASIVQGKLKLYEPVDKDSDPDTFTLSEGSTTTIKINDDDATADLWKGHLLVLTNGTYSGDSLLIQSNTASAGGTSTLTFRHTHSGTVNSTAGYLTQKYVMLAYNAKYTDISAYDGEVPIANDYEYLLGDYLNYRALLPSDKEYRGWKELFEENIQLVRNEVFTPEPEEGRPRARSMPGLENCEEYESYDSEYIGDDE